MIPWHARLLTLHYPAPQARAVLEIRSELPSRMTATAAASLDVPGMKDLAATARGFAKVVSKERLSVDEVQATRLLQTSDQPN